MYHKNIISRVLERFSFELRKEAYGPKVFCIGYNKTGTTSIGVALKQLGYRHSSFNKKVWRVYYKNNRVMDILRYTAKFDSFDDLPWLKEDMIPILDRVFLGSKFIYLTRDETSWKKSIYHWTFKIKGYYPDVDEEYRKFLKHSDFVKDYFSDRSRDIIYIDVSDPDAYNKLAEFLGVEYHGDGALPHHNKTFV